MTSRVETNFIQDIGSAGDVRATEALMSIRASIAQLEAGDILTPELFGAVANDPTAAVANFFALENWLNSGHLGLLLHHPDNVYHVAVFPIGGAGKFRAIAVRGRAYVPLLRIRPIKQGAGFGYFMLQFCTPNALGDATPQTLCLVAPSGNAAVTKGQTSFTVEDTAGPTFAPGDELLAVLGKDDYDIDEANGWYRRVKCISYTFTAGLGTLVIDTPVPRAFAQPTNTGDKSRFIKLDPSKVSDGSWFGHIEIDLADFPQNLGFAYTAFTFGCKNVTIETFAVRNPPDRDTENTMSLAFATENITVGSLLHITHPNNRARSGGGWGNFHDLNSRIRYARIYATSPSIVNFREGYAGSFLCDHVDIHYQSDQYGTDAGANILSAISESEAAIFNRVTIKTNLDLLSDPASSDQDNKGMRLAFSVTGAQSPIIGVLECDKDIRGLYCQPLFVDMKTVYGPLSYAAAQYTFGASAADAALDVDIDVGRVFYSTIQYIVPDFAGWDIFACTGPFDEQWATALGKNSKPLKYGIYGGFGVDNENPTAVWVEWIGNGYPNSVAHGDVNDATATFDRYLRYRGDAGEAAGNTIRLQYSFYPMKSTFTRIVE